MDIRQMQRLLKQEGFTFRQLSEQVLMEQAKAMLSKSNASILDIAVEFGYSDAANFTRAFKRWLGVSPSVFRESLQ
jgi:AraC-like DNA-binding protein